MPNFIYMRDWEVSNVQQRAETYVATATYKIEPDTCPSCGVVGELGRHGTKETAYKDAPVHGKQTTILAERRRYRCRACKATTIQPLPDIDDRRRMTKRCVQYIKDQVLRRTRQFSPVKFEQLSHQKDAKMTIIEKLESEYNFECEAGPLKNCIEWQQLATE